MTAKRMLRQLCMMSAVVLTLAVIGLWAPNAQAQTVNQVEVLHKNIHYFQPPTDGSGLLASWGSEPIGHLGFHLGTYYDYVNQPLEWTDPYDKTHILIYDQSAIQIHGGFGLFSGFSFSGSYATALSRSFNSDYLVESKETKNDLRSEASSSAVEDMRFSGKYSFRNRRYDKFGLALQCEVTMESGEEENFVSDEQMTVSPRVIFDMGNTWWSYVVNVGYKLYPDDVDGGTFKVDGGNELILTTGGVLRAWWGLELIADIHARTLMEEMFDSNVDYGEAIFALRSTWMANNPISIVAGSGFGFLDGAGTPVWRGFVGASFFLRELGLP